MTRIAFQTTRFNTVRTRTLVALAGLAFTPALAHAAPPHADGGPVANVELNAELGHQDLPGQKRAPHSREPKPEPKPTPTPTPEPAPREWFGHDAYRCWTRATGDWGGMRPKLEDQGITFAGSYIFDWSSVWDGGVRNKASSRASLDLNATFDSEKLLGYQGGALFVSFL